MYKFGVAVLFFVTIGASTIFRAAELDKEPPDELIQYVREAKRKGIKDSRIRRDAVTNGWPAATVDAALLYHSSAPEAGKASAVPSKKATPSARPSRIVETAAKMPSQGTLPPQTAISHSQMVEPPATSAPLSSPTIDLSSSIDSLSRNRGVPDDYVIGSGDVLQISVWKEPDASVPRVVVRPDGKIAMPLLKDVEVTGLTPRQVEKIITDRLSKLINGADVTVVVTTINSKKVYVVGAAKKEGPLPYTYQMSVIQAISEAGGLNDYAKRKKIYILRTENGKDYRLPFNYDEVVRGEKMDQNIQLLPGDTLVIPH
jgi:polysaccharide export outer membrane protein